MLTIGQKVILELVRKYRGRQIRDKVGFYIVQSFYKDRLYLKKDGSGYMESFQMWDFRSGRYQLISESGKRIPFTPLPDAKKIEDQKRMDELKEYREKTNSAWVNYEARKKLKKKAAEKMAMKESEIEHQDIDPENILVTLENAPALDRFDQKEEKEIIQEGSEIMLKMTKKEVLAMAADGKTLEEIVEYFTQGDNKHRSMYTAKATLFLNGPKEKLDGVTKEKVKQEAPKMPVTLKTRLIEDTETGMKFELEDDVLVMVLKEELEPVRIEWDKLDYHVSVLMKLKQIHEAV